MSSSSLLPPEVYRIIFKFVNDLASLKSISLASILLNDLVCRKMWSVTKLSSTEGLDVIKDCPVE